MNHMLFVVAVGTDLLLTVGRHPQTEADQGTKNLKA